MVRALLVFVGLAVIVPFCSADIVPLSTADKAELLNLHNELRSKANGVAMLRMRWNDDLAKYAESIASKCAFRHSYPRRNIGGFSYVGENIFVSTWKPSMKDPMTSWGKEASNYDIATNYCSGVCGHYTQIVWASTSDVGCAIAQCNRILGFQSGYLVFCNYGPGGNIIGKKPYDWGVPGSKCQQMFNLKAGTDGLCG